MLVRRCAKPDQKEFNKIIMATGMGFVLMGFIGFFVKVCGSYVSSVCTGMCA